MLFISQIHPKLFFVMTSDLSTLHVHLNSEAVTLSETRQIPHGSKLLALKYYSHSNRDKTPTYYNQPISHQHTWCSVKFTVHSGRLSHEQERTTGTTTNCQEHI